MNRALKVSDQIVIHASPEVVWEALTNPELIAVYLYGTKTTTNWEVGSSILFEGEYNGQTYRDKGNVIINLPFEKLQYNYWSGFSGLKDRPENYSIITYDITPLSDDTVTFIWTQEGFGSEEGMEHTKQGLGSILQQIKELAESKG